MRLWIIHHAIMAYALLAPFAWGVLAFAVIVLLPLALWRKTRPWAALGLFIASYALGIAAWLLGAAVTLGSFGWIGLIFGLCFFGVGVVPLAIIGAFFKLGVVSLGLVLCVLVAVTVGAHLGSAALAEVG